MPYSSDQWFEISRSLQLTAVEEPVVTRRTKYFLRKAYTGNYHTTSYRNTYEIFDYQLYDRKFQSVQIIYKGWKLSKFEEPVHKNLFFHVIICIQDPLGNERIFTDSFAESHQNAFLKQKGISSNTGMIITFGWEEKALVQALNYIKKLSKFSCWDHHDCALENSHLKKAIAILKKEASKEQ